MKYGALLGIVMLVVCAVAEAEPGAERADALDESSPGSLETQLVAARALASRVDAVSLFDSPQTGEPRLIIGDRYGIVRVSEFTASGLKEIWKSNPLQGAIFEVRTEDLDGEGDVEIVVRSDVRGHVHVYNSSFETVWASINFEYDGIQALDIANVDTDPALELIILADTGYIDYLDGKSLVREFRSNQPYEAEDIEVGNVDIDSTLELVLNTGIVLDTLNAEPEWVANYFGTFIELFDVDGDGIEEILAHELLQPLIIYDADFQEEKPLR